MPGHFTFYSNKINVDIAYFDETEFKHAIQVLRYQQGDSIQFTDGVGGIYTGTIHFVGKREFTAEIQLRRQVDPLPTVIVGLGILKSSDRMEWAVEKCTELGVTEIWFLKTKNSERTHLNIDRMHKVALSAVKQSHGSYVPKIEVYGMEAAIHNVGGRFSSKYLAYCGEGSVIPVAECNIPCVFLIGPEGDFTDAELSLAIQHGFQGVGLGASILRTETAAIAALATMRLK